MTAADVTTCSSVGCRTQRVVLWAGERKWTLLDDDHRVVEPAEQHLEYLRRLRRSPNTVKSYARALAFVVGVPDRLRLAWDGVTVEDLGGFLGWLRTGDSPAVVSIERRLARFGERTVALRGARRSAGPNSASACLRADAQLTHRHPRLR